MTAFDTAAARIARAVDERTMPAAVVEVGRTAGRTWRQAFGRMTYEADAPPATEDTIFDLASLTKVIATTTLCMRALEQGRLMPGTRVREFLREWRGADREDVTVRDLLAHCSGLTGYLPFYTDPAVRGRAAFERAICELPLEYAPRTQAIYSDLGFMLLGFILEDAFSRPLVDSFELVRSIFTSDILMFKPDPALKSRVAPTEQDPWRGRLLVGEVHDENCWALGGVAGARSPAGARSSASPHAQPRSPGAAARSAGTRCCARRHAARGSRAVPSGTPASPAHRSGSIRSRTSTSCSSPTACTRPETTTA
jgi:CubicO group peptidase (beta-lactamase class C family)